MTEYIDTKYVSAELKRRILQKFPGIEKLSVTTGTGTASAWISVRWTDGPSVDAVEKLTGPMHGARWNGMTDSYDRVDSTVTVTIKGRGRVTGKPLVDGINCHREVSADALAEARRLWSEHFDGADPATAGRKEAFSVRGRLIHDNWADIQVRQIAETVVLPERWAALQAEREKTQKQQKTDAGAAPSGEGIVISHTEKDGTTVTGTRRGDGAAEILKDHKLRWYGKGGFWYIPRSRGQQADAARIDAIAEALRAAGLTVTTMPAGAGQPEPEKEGEKPVVPDSARRAARRARLLAEIARLGGRDRTAHHRARDGLLLIFSRLQKTAAAFDACTVPDRVPAKAAKLLQEIQECAQDHPQAEFPVAVLDYVTGPVTGRTPTLPVLVSAGPDLARQANELRMRAAASLPVLDAPTEAVAQKAMEELVETCRAHRRLAEKAEAAAGENTQTAAEAAAVAAVLRENEQRAAQHARQLAAIARTLPAPPAGREILEMIACLLQEVPASLAGQTPAVVDGVTVTNTLPFEAYTALWDAAGAAEAWPETGFPASVLGYVSFPVTGVVAELPSLGADSATLADQETDLRVRIATLVHLLGGSHPNEVVRDALEGLVKLHGTFERLAGATRADNDRPGSRPSAG